MTSTRPDWDRVAPSKRFTHPLDVARLAELLPRSARLLDFGCGYGRLVAELRVEELLEGFEPVHRQRLDVLTMNGNPARAFQVIARRTGVDRTP